MISSRGTKGRGRDGLDNARCHGRVTALKAMEWTGRVVAGVWGAEGGVRVIEGKSWVGGRETLAKKKWMIKEELERRFGM